MVEELLEAEERQRKSAKARDFQSGFRSQDWDVREVLEAEQHLTNPQKTTSQSRLESGGKSFAVTN